MQLHTPCACRKQQQPEYHVRYPAPGIRRSCKHHLGAGKQTMSLLSSPLDYLVDVEITRPSSQFDMKVLHHLALAETHGVL